jgi:hypothetical protein
MSVPNMGCLPLFPKRYPSSSALEAPSPDHDNQLKPLGIWADSGSRSGMQRWGLWC